MEELSEKQKDLEIIQRVRKGDCQAYADIVRRYQVRVLAHCRTMIGQADAEDAAQEAFFKAYQSLDQFREDSSFYTWLYRIASNHCLTLLRSKSRKPVESLDAIAEDQKEGLLNLFSQGPDFRDTMDARQLVERVLSALPPNYCLVLTLRERDGMSYEEIAQVMENSVDSVKALLRRARVEVEEKLRHFLPPDGV